MAKKSKEEKKSKNKKTEKKANKDGKKKRGRKKRKGRSRKRREKRIISEREERIKNWVPKTELGEKIMSGEIKSMDGVFAKGMKIKEPEIVDYLLPNIDSELILIGGTPGKGGGIRRTPTRRTSRMHRSGRRYNISAMVAVGNKNGYIGIGKAVGTEHSQAIEKATNAAKLSVIPVKRGCGSWECGCGETHTIPFAVTGKSGSIEVRLMPAPKGIGLCIMDELKKVMRLAGIEDIWSKTIGDTRTRINTVQALFDAFRELNAFKETDKFVKKSGAKMGMEE